MTPTLAAWLHNIDPYLIKLWEGGPIRWYGIAYLAGFFVGFWLIRRVTRVGISPIKPAQAADLVLTSAIGIVAGGRLGYALFYKPELFRSPIELVSLHHGGMASHGGMLGLMLAMAWYARRHRVSWLHLMDLAAFAFPIGIFFGRVANFVNGELLGRPCKPDFPLAVKFPQEIGEYWTRDQLQDLAHQLPPVPDDQSLSYRVVQQVQAGNEAVIRVVEPLLAPRHPSQLYEAAMEGLLLMLILLVFWRKPRKPGLVYGTFGLCYCIVRIVGERFRLPDAHIAHLEYARWEITRGQLLSVAFLLLGITIITISLTSKAQPLGGWLPVAKSEERKAKSAK